jgi:hypothetical protein
MLMVRCQKMLRCRADQRKRNIAAPRRESLDASKLRQCEIGTISAPSRLQPTWVAVVFRRKYGHLKKLERISIQPDRVAL